jgi:hypothetical protein
MTPPRLLVLFPGRWETELLESMAAAGELRVARAGVPTFGWRRLLAGTRYDPRREVESICRRFAGAIDGVWSGHDMLGSLMAAAVARRLGLPGITPEAVVRCQHKVLAATTLAELRSDGPRLTGILPGSLEDAEPPSEGALATAVGDRWPIFVRPVRGTFSAMARRIRNVEELRRHLQLGYSDRWLFGAATRAFDRLAAEFLALPCPSGSICFEPVIEAPQVNVDFVCGTESIDVLGIVDELMYPGESAGARHFAGFELPSRQAEPLRRSAAELVAVAARAIGISTAVCNAECFVLPNGRAKLIELNPRAAGQFDGMYAAVHGIRPLRMAIDLALGRMPGIVASLGRAVAASIVFRTFEGRPSPRLRAGARTWLRQTYPDARLWYEPARPWSRARELRWLGSHRYAVLQVAAADAEGLAEVAERCARRLFGVAAPVGIC